jgi:hypothetical protein
MSTAKEAATKARAQATVGGSVNAITSQDFTFFTSTARKPPFSAATTRLLDA